METTEEDIRGIGAAMDRIEAEIRGLNAVIDELQSQLDDMIGRLPANE